MTETRKPPSPSRRDQPLRTLYVTEEDYRRIAALLKEGGVTQREFFSALRVGLANLVDAAKAYSPNPLARNVFIQWAMDFLLSPAAIEARLTEIQAAASQELMAEQDYDRKYKHKRGGRGARNPRSFPVNPKAVMAPNNPNRELVRILRESSGDGGAAEGLPPIEHGSK